VPSWRAWSGRRRSLDGCAGRLTQVPDIGAVDEDESDRLSALSRLQIVDTGPEPEYDALVSVAATVCDVPFAAISFVDDRRQWFKARFGFDVAELPLEMSMCLSTVRSGRPLEVPDAWADQRFAGHPMASGASGVRSYAGVPLRVGGGPVVGTLCVLDRRARSLTAAQMAALEALGRQAEQLLWLRVQLTTAAERELSAQLSAGRVRALLDALEQGLIVYDAMGVVRLANPAADRILGGIAHLALRDDREPTRFRLIGLDGGPIEVTHTPAWRAIHRREFASGVLIGIVLAGQPTIWVDVTAAPLDNGEVVVSFVDVTELVETRRRLEESLVEIARVVQVKTVLQSAISHDLRSPLAAIRMFAELVARDGAVDEAHRHRILSRIAAEAQRTERILTDLSVADRLASTSIPVTAADVDLRWVAEEASAPYRDLAAIVVDVASAPVLVRADRAQLERIIDNLVANAVKHNPPDTPVRITVGTAVDGTRFIDVDDEGVGIGEDLVDAMFEPYVRGPHAHLVPGSGLGLYLCRTLAEMHGGRLGYEPIPTGGSRFRLALPALSKW
jgi:two-component system, NtrC family, sensor kinase